MALIEQRQWAGRKLEGRRRDKGQLNQMGILLEGYPQGVRWSYKK